MSEFPGVPVMDAPEHVAHEGQVELVADEGVVYADEGGLGNSDYEGAKYARGAQAAGAMPEE